MVLKLVECLNCGAARRVANQPSRPTQQDECTRCGYVGWAESKTLTETLRRALRDHTVDQRRVRLATW
jgi:Zn ribbon nucleic-acid-binding protein